VLDQTNLSKEEKVTVKTQIENGSHMVAMIFKFFLQSGEYEFFVRRLKNLVTQPSHDYALRIQNASPSSTPSKEEPIP
jgi:hypothetical protein